MLSTIYQITCLGNFEWKVDYSLPCLQNIKEGSEDRKDRKDKKSLFKKNSITHCF